MKVIVDNKIPYINEAIEKLADEVVYLPGASFTPEAVKDADALIVRTRTLCNRELLEGSQVRFIATATIGYDHIDTDYCQKAGIVWTNCPGCNAGSVEQYVHSVLLLLKREKGLDLEHSTIGVVGVGHVGSRVASMAKNMPRLCFLLFIRYSFLNYPLSLLAVHSKDRLGRKAHFGYHVGLGLRIAVERIRLGGDVHTVEGL